MNRRLKRKVAIGAVGALAIAGGGAAYAASGATDPQDALLDNAAKRLDVTPEKLRSALEGAFGDQLDQAVKDGRLTQKQADRIKQDVAKGGLPPLGGPGPGVRMHFRAGGPPHAGGMMMGPIGLGLDTAADYLGLSEAQLRARLRNSKSLADVAKAEGKSVDGLQQAILDAAKTQLDKAVADGDLTQKQADTMLEDLTDHVDEMIQGKGPGPGGPCGPGGPGFGGPPRLERRSGSGESGSSAVPGSFESAPSPVAGSV